MGGQDALPPVPALRRVCLELGTGAALRNKPAVWELPKTRLTERVALLNEWQKWLRVRSASDEGLALRPRLRVGLLSARRALEFAGALQSSGELRLGAASRYDVDGSW